MNTEQFKEKLLAEKALLESELGGIAKREPSNPSNWQAVSPEPADETDFSDEIADRLEENVSREATSVPLEARLKEVEAALQRIADGTYGICERGGESIEEARLDANPAARTCIEHVDQSLAQ